MSSIFAKAPVSKPTAIPKKYLKVQPAEKKSRQFWALAVLPVLVLAFIVFYDNYKAFQKGEFIFSAKDNNDHSTKKKKTKKTSGSGAYDSFYKPGMEGLAKEVIGEKKEVFSIFYSKNCTYCKKLANAVKKVQNAKGFTPEYFDSSEVKLAWINVDEDVGYAFREKFGIDRWPIGGLWQPSESLTSTDQEKLSFASIQAKHVEAVQKNLDDLRSMIRYEISKEVTDTIQKAWEAEENQNITNDEVAAMIDSENFLEDIMKNEETTNHEIVLLSYLKKHILDDFLTTEQKFHETLSSETFDHFPLNLFAEFVHTTLRGLMTKANFVIKQLKVYKDSLSRENFDKIQAWIDNADFRTFNVPLDDMQFTLFSGPPLVNGAAFDRITGFLHNLRIKNNDNKSSLVGDQESNHNTMDYEIFLQNALYNEMYTSKFVIKVEGEEQGVISRQQILDKIPQKFHEYVVTPNSVEELQGDEDMTALDDADASAAAIGISIFRDDVDMDFSEAAAVLPVAAYKEFSEDDAASIKRFLEVNRLPAYGPYWPEIAEVYEKDVAFWIVAQKKESLPKEIAAQLTEEFDFHLKCAYSALDLDSVENKNIKEAGILAEMFQLQKGRVNINKPTLVASLKLSGKRKFMRYFGEPPQTTEALHGWLAEGITEFHAEMNREKFLQAAEEDITEKNENDENEEDLEENQPVVEKNEVEEKVVLDEVNKNTNAGEVSEEAAIVPPENIPESSASEEVQLENESPSEEEV